MGFLMRVMAAVIVWAGLYGEAQVIHFPGLETPNVFQAQNQFSWENNVLYAGSSIYPTIQDALTTACTIGTPMTVEVQVGTNAGTDITALTGCGTVGITDKRSVIPQFCTWTSAYACVAGGGGGGGGGASPVVAGSGQFANSNASGFSSSGQYLTSVFATNSSNGISNTLGSAACSSGSNCDLLVSQVDTDNESPNILLTTQSQTHITDRRNGSFIQNFVNPGSYNFVDGSVGASPTGYGTNCLFTQDPLVDYPPETCESNYTVGAGSGINTYGFAGNNWQVEVQHTNKLTTSYSGIHEQYNNVLYAWGAGDVIQTYDYFYYRSVIEQPSDESVKHNSFNMYEADSPIGHSLSHTATTLTTDFNQATSGDGNNVGQGLRMVETPEVNASGLLTAQTTQPFCNITSDTISSGTVFVAQCGVTSLVGLPTGTPILVKNLSISTFLNANIAMTLVSANSTSFTATLPFVYPSQSVTETGIAGAEILNTVTTSDTHAVSTGIGTLSCPVLGTTWAINSSIITINGNNTYSPGDTIMLFGYPVSTFLNGQKIRLTTANSTTVTAPFPYATNTSATENGYMDKNIPVLQDHPVNVVCSVSVTSGSFTTGPVSIGDSANPEQSQLTKSGSIYTFSLTKQHPVGTPIYQGGLAGNVIVLGNGYSSIADLLAAHPPVHMTSIIVAGSSGANTLNYILPLLGNADGQVSMTIPAYQAVPINSETRAVGTGVVTVTPSGNQYFVYNNIGATLGPLAVISVSGASDSSFNENIVHTQVPVIGTTADSTGIHYTSLTTTAGTSTGGTLSITGVNNYFAVCYADITKVNATMDIQGNAVESPTFGVEPNSCPWTSGDFIIQANGDTVTPHVSGFSAFGSTPASGIGQVMVLGGPAYGLPGASYFNISTTDDLFQEFGYGGTLTRDLFDIAVPVAVDFNFDYQPSPGGTIINVGCLKCSATTPTYGIAFLNSFVGLEQLFFNPGNGNMGWTSQFQAPTLSTNNLIVTNNSDSTQVEGTVTAGVLSFNSELGATGFGSGSFYIGVPAPSIPGIYPAISGTTTWYYMATSTDYSGESLPNPNPGSTNMGPSTISGTDYIRLVAFLKPGATGVKFYRWLGTGSNVDPTQYRFVCAAYQTCNDAGGSLGSPPPVIDTTASLVVAGSQVITSVQGTTGTKLSVASGTFTNGNLRSTNSTGDEIDSTIAVSAICLMSGTNCPISVFPFSFTTTAATTDVVTVTGMTSSGHCSALSPTNASAGTMIQNATPVYIDTFATNAITVHHVATAGATFNGLCTPN
jgi:hypothetical protein